MHNENEDKKMKNLGIKYGRMMKDEGNLYKKGFSSFAIKETPNSFLTLQYVTKHNQEKRIFPLGRANKKVNVCRSGEVEKSKKVEK